MTSIILSYHRVTKSEQPDFLPFGLNCPASGLQNHLDVLKRHCSVLPLEEAWNHVREGRYPNYRFYYLASRVGVELLMRILQSLLPSSSMVTPAEAAPVKFRHWLESTPGYTLASESGRVFLDTLERDLGVPYGQFQDFNERSVKIAAELGHRCACTTIRGYNDGDTDPMRLRRINPMRLSGEELASPLL
jgi:hypothetical protein